LCGSNKCFARLEMNDRLRKIYEDNPILKINYVPYSKGYFQLYISSELPVFIVNNDSINLSSDELITAIKNIISFADNLENSLYSGESDIKNSDIIKAITTLQNNNGSPCEKILGEDRPPDKEILDWEINSTNQYYFKSRIANNNDKGQSIYEYNDLNNLIRKINVNQNTFYQVGLYKSDALSEELELMKKIIENAL